MNKKEKMITLVALAAFICIVAGLHFPAAHALAPSAVLPPRTSPVAQEPLVTPTPFPTSPLLTVPKLSERKTATTPTALNSFLKHEGFGVVILKQANFDSDPK